MIHLCIGMDPGIVASACIYLQLQVVLLERTQHPADPLYGCHPNIYQKIAILGSVFNYKIHQNLTPNYITCISHKWKLYRACEAYPAGENSSFIFTICVKSVPRYHFKLAYVHMAVKDFFETHF